VEPSTETSRCLLASGTGRNISAETFLIESNEWDDCVDVIQFGDPADDDPPVVRKLMPLEWERLMRFPDDYTLVRYRGPAGFCPDAPRYKALGNSIVVPMLRWIGERIAMVDALPAAELVHPEDLAKTLSDSELVEKCVQGFRDLREANPYLREARGRFAQPGRRVPVPGNPTWTEWVQANLHVTARRVQQLLSEGAEPRETISLGSKHRKLRTGDWRGLLKATERRTAQVFGSVEDPKRLAGAICDFAQGTADRYARPGGKLVVSVSLKTRN
jgi:C-5 cytosine-specific DNA methylase